MGAATEYMNCHGNFIFKPEKFGEPQAMVLEPLKDVAIPEKEVKQKKKKRYGFWK